MPSPFDPHSLLNFLKAAGDLKRVERFKGQFFWKDRPQPDKYESVADHTWRMTLMVMLIEKQLSQPIDVARALKMAIVHDIAEVITGDWSPLGTDGTGKDSHIYNTEKAQAKFQNEEQAVRSLFGHLAPEQAKEFYDIWMEYEKQETFESRVVKAIDKIEGKLQAVEYTPDGMVEKHLEFSLAYGLKHYEADPALKELGMTVNSMLKKKE